MPAISVLDSIAVAVVAVVLAGTVAMWAHRSQDHHRPIEAAMPKGPGGIDWRLWFFIGLFVWAFVG